MICDYNLQCDILSYFISASVVEALWAHSVYHGRFSGVYRQFTISHGEIGEEPECLIYLEAFHDM